MNKIALILFVVGVVLCSTMPVWAQEAAAPTAAAPTTAAPAATEEEETDIVAGKVSAVDVAAATVTVTDEGGKSYTVAATKEETSIWKGDDTIELANIAVGDPVELEYYKNKESKLVAIWIDVLTAEIVPPAEVKPEAVPAPEPAPEVKVESTAAKPEPTQ